MPTLSVVFDDWRRAKALDPEAYEGLVSRSPEEVEALIEKQALVRVCCCGMVRVVGW